MTKALTRHLRRVVGGGLFFLLAFTPLAFGAVEEWAKAIAQFVIMAILAAWVLELTWVTPSSSSTARGMAGSHPPGLLAGRVQLSGLEFPALMFALVIGFQLVPLPPSWVRALSPKTAEIYARSLPGYGQVDQPTFSGLPRWLQSDPDPQAGDVAALPPDPEAASHALPPEVFERAHPARRSLSMTPANTRRALEIYLAHFALFVVTFNCLDRRTRSLRYLYLLAGLAGMLAVLGILQTLTGTEKLYWWRSVGGSGSPFGPFGSRNNFAGWMEMVLPICVGLVAMFCGRADRRGGAVRMVERAGNFPTVLVSCFVSVVGLTAFLFARSRGGLLALAGATCVYGSVVLVRDRPRPRVLVGLLLLIVLSVAMAAWIGGEEIWSRYETLGRLDDEPSFRFRLATTRRTLEMASDFPLFGTGLGTFEQAFYLYTPGTSDRILKRAHNDYAQLISEAGLLGTVAMVWGLIVILRGLGPALRSGGGASRWPFRGVAVGVLALLLHSFCDFNMQIYSNSILFVFLCALMLRDRRGETRDATDPA